MAFFRELQRIYSRVARKLRRIRNSKKKQDLSSANTLSSEDVYIPEEIMVDILSRLPTPSVLRCKCVCKSWMQLVETLEFAKSHVSNSVPGTARAASDEDPPFTLSLFHCSLQRSSKSYQILELVNTQNSGSHPSNVAFKFNFPGNENLRTHSSVNGLLLMLDKDRRNLSICNPITREYIKLPPLSLPPPGSHLDSYYEKKAFGFGVSKVSGKYKVVRVSLDRDDNPPLVMNTSKYEVYTLGTGSWRGVAGGAPREYWMCGLLSVFLNGNLHWLVRYTRDVVCSVLYFDLETERFSTFSVPACAYGMAYLCTFGGSMCLCSNDWHNVEIWLMNKYGDDKSWRKLEFVIDNKLPNSCVAIYQSLVPQKMSKDGDILFTNKFGPRLYCYSSKTRTIREVGFTKLLGRRINFEPNIIYAPSFLPLKTFTMEDVSTF